MPMSMTVLIKAASSIVLFDAANDEPVPEFRKKKSFPLIE